MRLFPLLLPFIPADDPIELQQFFVFQAGIGQHGIRQQDHIADLRQRENRQNAQVFAADPVGLCHLAQLALAQSGVRHRPHIEKAVVGAETGKITVKLVTAQERAGLPQNALPHELPKLFRLHQGAVGRAVEKGSQTAVRSLVHQVYLDHATENADMVFTHGDHLAAIVSQHDRIRTNFSNMDMLF